MLTEIVIKPAEFDKSLIDIVKRIIKEKNISEITISLNDKKPAKYLRKETQAQTNSRIEKAIKDIESGNANLVSFTGDEFENFSKSLMKK
jgi:hypothetical protein